MVIKNIQLIIRKLLGTVLYIGARIVYIYYSVAWFPLHIRDNSTDWQVFLNIYLLGELKTKLSYEPQFIIDAGAYTGLSAVYYAKQFPNAKVIAIEPESSNYKVLIENTKNLSNVIAVNAGLWNKESYLKIIDRKTGKWGFALEEVSKNKSEITGISLNQIIKQFNIKNVDILKVDIEGSETVIFSKNFQKWLKKVKCIQIELHNHINSEATSIFFNAVKPKEWNISHSGEKVVAIRKEYKI